MALILSHHIISFHTLENSKGSKLSHNTVPALQAWTGLKICSMDSDVYRNDMIAQPLKTSDKSEGEENPMNKNIGEMRTSI